MKPQKPTRSRVRLDPDAYEKLRQGVLERDGWRCQFCGSRIDLHVHHQQHRSQSGDDDECNLITLCASCHREIHAAKPHPD